MKIGKRLEFARRSLALSLEAAGQEAGIGISTLSELENDKREPSIRQLSVLAKTYSRSLSYFLDDEDTVSEPMILWRERPADAVARTQEAKFRKLCEQYRDLEVWCQSVIAPSLPPCVVNARTFEQRDAESLAREIRRELNLGDYPAYGLLNALENTCGIKIFHDTFEPTGTAACVCSDLYGMAILLNSGNTTARRSFDLAHELFHLLTWDCFRNAKHDETDGTDEPKTRASKDEERWAGVFATSLLIPPDALQEAVERKLSREGKLAIAVLPTLAEQFGVSVEAMSWRIHNVYNLGKNRTDETKQAIVAARKITDHRFLMEGAEAAPPKYPKRYRALAIQALVTGQMSTGKFCDYTGWSRREAMNLVSEDAFGEIQVTAP